MHQRKIKSDLRVLFQEAVSYVNPRKLIDDNINTEWSDGTEYLVVDGKYYSLFMDIFVVGFGKAVLGMGRALEDHLPCCIRRGILNVPMGTLKHNPRLVSNTMILSKLHVFECAQDNLPDEAAQSSAQQIAELVRGLDENCVLIVLISGGGSALLPLPVADISLQEKVDVTKMLSHAGANISEINCVRRKLSQLKGGKLAQLAHPARVISLILSDVIGDPSDVASGPTFPCRDEPNQAWEVVKKYNLQREITENVRNVLKSQDDISLENEFDHVQNVVIGNNVLALKAIERKARSMDYICIVLSDKIQGLVRNVSSLYCSMATNICELRSSKLDIEQFNVNFENIKKECEISVHNADLVEVILSSKDSNKPICLILGGETTVQVKGCGLGGRNQQLALEFSIMMHKMWESNPVLNDFEVVLLSAGTDGIDGPTDAAGAFGYAKIIDKAKKQGLDPTTYLENNDSHNFFNKLNNCDEIIRTGHTGTNVMDVHIIVIENRTLSHCEPKCTDLMKPIVGEVI